MRNSKIIMGGGKYNSLLSVILIVSVILISLFSVSCKEPVYYSVIFESNGGTAVPAQSVQEGKTVTKPANPTKDGCVFEGWYSDSSLSVEYNFSTPVNNDFVLYAKWSTPTPPPKTTHTVNFQSLGGTNVEDQEVEDGQCAVEPKEPTRRGYTFFGWYTELPQQTQYEFSTPVTEDLILYAKWVKKSGTSYKVTYTSGEGTGKPVEDNVKAGAYTLMLNTPATSVLKALSDKYTNFTNNDLSFLQWNIGGVKLYDGTVTEVDDDLEAEATWIDASSIGSFDDDGVFVLNSSSTEVAVPRVLTNEGNKLVESVKASSFDGSVLYLPPSVSVIPDGAFSGCVNLQSIYFNTVEPPVVGDNAFPNNVKIYIPEDADTSEYAQALGVDESKIENIDYVVEYFMVDFDSDGGTAVASQEVLKGSTASQPTAPSKSNYTFSGWCSDAGLVTPYDFSTPVTADITLYAKWVSSGYTVTYEKNGATGGTVPTDTTRYASGTQVTVLGNPTTPNTLTRGNNELFECWNTKADGTGKKYYAGDTFAISADITLHAQWTTYLTFSVNSGTVSVTPSRLWNVEEAQYSTDGGSTWTPIVKAGTMYPKVSGSTIMFRGVGGSVGSAKSTSDYAAWNIEGTDVSCTGNIETILDYKTVESGKHPDMNNYCYGGMFIICTSLTTAPELPATSLTEGCYYRMFYGCSKLETAPELPATTLANSCYKGMFYNCSKLETAPVLPATTLANECYREMFYSCSELETAPALPATALASQCYYQMFRGCSELETAPALPATTLCEKCYYGMFYGCSKLETAPTLPATKLATRCYANMFNGCSSLKKAPNLPATQLATGCYSCMFSGCTDIDIKDAVTKLVSHVNFSDADVGNKSKITSGGCVGLFAGIGITDAIIADLVTADVLPYNPDTGKFWLPATDLASECYSQMFASCTSLVTAPELPATSLANLCYFYMFSGCTSLTVAPKLPVETLATSCYEGMFLGCTSLTVAPDLPANPSAPVTDCYKWMFGNCSKLTSIKVGFTDWNNVGTAGWVTNAGTDSAAVFTCPASLPLNDASYWGVGKAPAGDKWTVTRTGNKVGGRIFYDDGTSNGLGYKFYKGNGDFIIDLSDVKATSEQIKDSAGAGLSKADTYTVSGLKKANLVGTTPVADRFYVYDKTTGLVSGNEWGAYDTSVGITTDGIGQGKKNTAIALGYAATHTDVHPNPFESGSSDPYGTTTIWTWLKDDINANNVGDCSDWFIGSKAEVDILRETELVDWFDYGEEYEIFTSVEYYEGGKSVSCWYTEYEGTVGGAWVSYRLKNFPGEVFAMRAF